MGTAMTSPEVCVPERTALFERVLVASDFSPAAERAFRTGIRLAKQLGAAMTLLHVFEYANPLREDPGGELGELLVKARHRLEKYTALAQAEGVACKGELRGGFPPEGIVEAAEQQGCDLVVMGTNGFRGFERLVFGSTAEAVMRSAACPVMTLGPRVHPDRVGPVVFATDFHNVTRGAGELARTMSMAMGVPLHLLHVLPRSVEEDASGNVVPHIMQEALAHLMTEDDGKRPVCAVVYGSEVSQAVVEYARKHEASAIVLGVRKLSLMAAHAPAQIAYRMIAEANCPVVTSCSRV